MSGKNSSPWFHCMHPRPSAKLRLLCFPWAGGGSNVYARWGSSFPEDIEVIGVRLPGRESRAKDPYMTDINQMSKIISEEIFSHYKDKPLAFFGHSMGLMVSYETAYALRKNHGINPVHLFFSGSFAAHSAVRKKRVEDATNKGIHTNTDEELIEWLTKTGGTPKQLLENEEYMQYFLPYFRADLTLAYKYYRPEASKEPFSCGITLFDGKEDSDHFPNEFKDLTTDTFENIMFPGGHFYLFKDNIAKELHESMIAKLNELC